MQVTFYGTRGSCPVAHTSKIKYGGNTIPVFGCRDYMVVEIENVAGALA